MTAFSGPSAEHFLNSFAAWASSRDDILGVLLVGSYARGEASPDSDVDLVVLTTSPSYYLSSFSWVSSFGDYSSCSVEDWGEVQSVRVFFSSGLEVEAGIALPSWIGHPIPPTTAAVLRSGCRVLFDRDGSVSASASLFSQTD
jgi:predicted nucleotidyltransferase